MNRVLILSLLLLAAIVAGRAAYGAETAGHHRVKLFGVPIKGATRAIIRDALKRHGLAPMKDSDQPWADQYDATSLWSEPSVLTVEYTSDDRFAAAEYVFPLSSIDPDKVKHVIRLVSTKYGPPDSHDESIFNEYRAAWNLGDGMRILVSRGDPFNFTFLRYIDTAQYKRRQTELRAKKKADLKREAQQRDAAF